MRPLAQSPEIPDMTALSLQFMRSLPVSAVPLRGFRSGFRHLSMTETRGPCCYVGSITLHCDLHFN